MTLQELVNKLSNILATMPGDTAVSVEVAGNQEIADNVTVEDTEEGQVIIIR